MKRIKLFDMLNGRMTAIDRNLFMMMEVDEARQWSRLRKTWWNCVKEDNDEFEPVTRECTVPNWRKQIKGGTTS